METWNWLSYHVTATVRLPSHWLDASFVAVCHSRDFVQRSPGHGRWFLYKVAWNNLYGRARPWLEASLWGNQAGILSSSGQLTNVNIFMMSLLRWLISLKSHPPVSCMGYINLVASFMHQLFAQLKVKLGKQWGAPPSSVEVSPSSV